MNLLDRIEHALADTALRIDPAVFEECATALLSEIFQNLVPIRGGSDSGRDADLVRSSGEAPTRVAITSSRSYEGARANLRSSIESLKRHGLAGTSIVAVSLAELNQSKRQKLEALAADQGFELGGVIDRAYFAQRLSVDGAWRSKLLHLPGGPFSLSKTSGYFAIDQQTDGLVGRDQLIEQLTSLNSDTLIWGPPGAGKSSVLEHIPGLYFVDGEPSAERLQDDILATSPRLIVVDDASRRTQVLDLLLQIRKHESLTYLIIAVCWPHEREAIALHLPTVAEIEVELLTPREISEIVKKRGITAHITLVRILEQARGRPGWAVRLTDLLRKNAEWRSVYSGEALRGEVRKYLLRAGLPNESLQLLAIIGLLGGITDTEIGQLAQTLGMSRPQLARAITDIAVGGLLDVRKTSNWNAAPEVSYTVAPDVLATSIVNGVFFNDEVPPVSAQELFDGWPSKRLAIATVTIRAVLLGADQASALARKFFAEVIDASEVPGNREELLHHYLHLGNRQATEVLDRLSIPWREPGHLNEASIQELESQASPLVSFICEAIESGLGAAADYAVQIAAVLDQRDADVSEFLKKLVDGVRGFGPNGRVRMPLVVDLWRSFEQEALKRRAEGLGSVLVRLLRECMRPTFEGTWSRPESWRTIQMASGVLASSDMSYLAENVWASFERLLPELSRDQLEVLVEVIGDWVQVAGDYALAFGGRATAEQVREATAATQRIATWVLERCAPYPGLRAAIRMHIKRIGVPVPEDDPLIEAFFDTREPGEDWRAWGEAHRAQIAGQVSPLLEDPERLGEVLLSVKHEIATIRNWAFADPIRIAFAVVDEADVDHLTWLKMAHRRGLLPEADILLRRVLREGTYDLELIRSLLTESSARGTIIAAALELENDSPLFELVYPEISPDDVGQLQLAIHRDSCSESAIRALLTHPVEGVRAAIAAALLASSEDQEAFDTTMFDGAWRSAILELRVPLEFKLVFGKHDFFEKLLQRVPDIYEELLLRVVSAPGDSLEWRALHDAFEDTASMLPGVAKTRVWDKVPPSYWRQTIFQTLAGSDSEWIESLLESGRVDAEFVLGSVNGLGKSPPIEDLARMLVPRGCDPTHVASKVQYGTGWGEQHERIAGHLELMSRLEESTESSVRAVGEAGRAYFAPLHEQALRDARQKEIRGEL